MLIEPQALSIQMCRMRKECIMQMRHPDALLHAQRQRHQALRTEAAELFVCARSPQWLVMEMNRTLDDMCAEHRATQGGRLLSSLTYYESCPLFLRKFLAPGTPEKLIDLLHELRITTTIQSAVDSSR